MDEWWLEGSNGSTKLLRTQSSKVIAYSRVTLKGYNSWTGVQCSRSSAGQFQDSACHNFSGFLCGGGPSRAIREGGTPKSREAANEWKLWPAGHCKNINVQAFQLHGRIIRIVFEIAIYIAGTTTTTSLELAKNCHYCTFVSAYSWAANKIF